MMTGNHGTPPTQPGPQPAQQLRVDWPRCVGRGLCAELLPEWITLDQWGYPIVGSTTTATSGATVSADPSAAMVTAAVAACPHQALRHMAPASK